MTKPVCDGSCKVHYGQVRRVRVVAVSGHDWGEFDYCKVAIDEDTQRRNMIVTLIPPLAND